MFAPTRRFPRPDGIELSENHYLTIRYGVTGTARHVTLTDEKGNILVEMSGHVVVDADMLVAEALQVDVHNTELNLAGGFRCFDASIVLVHDS